jgi:hypothetical protein
VFDATNAEAPAELEQSDDPVDSTTTYWATLAGRDLASAIRDKEEAYFETARNRGLLALWVIAYAAHHGLTPEDLRDFATQQIGFQGNELELLRFHINLVRGYARHQTTLALGEEPAFKAMVVNSDHRSQAKAEVVDRILNGIYKRYCAPFDEKVGESDSVLGEGGTHTRWDFVGGDNMKVSQPIPQPDGTQLDHYVMKKSGAPYDTVVYPWSHVHETRQSGDELWCVIRENESKWNTIAMFPHLKEQILNVAVGIDKYDFGTLFRLEDLEIANKDLITVKHFYHARCAAIPEGRYAIMYEDVLLYDGPCPTKTGMPFAAMRSGEFIETNLGYADIWDLIAVQQALNQVNSDELQNYATFGRQSIGIEKGTEVTIDAIAKGTAFYFPQGGKSPQAVQLVAVPETLPDLKTYLHKQLDNITGQNAASRGDPDPNVRSGEMQALNQSLAISYQSFRQKSARKYRIRKAEILVDMFDRYAETPFFVEVIGVEQRSYVAEYTKGDLSSIERITIDQVSPMMQSIAGRLQVFQQVGGIVDPEMRSSAYEFITTGNTSAFLMQDRATDLYIRRENEDLVTGERDVPVNACDDPYKHMPKHYAQRQMIMASDNPDLEAVGRIDQHMLQHQQAYLGLSPVLAAMFQIPPPPAIPPGPSAPQGNPVWQLQMMGAMSAPQAGPTPGGAQPSGQGGGAASGGPPKPPAGPTDGAGANAGIPRETDPTTGTKLPQPSQAPPSAAPGQA